MRKGSLLATIWENGIVRSTVGASATTALVATMMFGGGGFNPAVASTANDQAVPTELPLVKATQSAEATTEASAAKAAAASPSPATARAVEPVEKQAAVTKEADSTEATVSTTEASEVEASKSETPRTTAPKTEVPVTKKASETKKSTAPKDERTTTDALRVSEPTDDPAPSLMALENPTVAALAAIIGGFEIDGNLTPNDMNPSGDDWNNVNPTVATDGFNDATGLKGTEFDVNGWQSEVFTGSGKADIGRVWTHSRIQNENQYFFMAFDRAAGNGSVGYAIELNQVSSSALKPIRTDGDIFISITQGGNAGFSILDVGTWSNGAWVWKPIAQIPSSVITGESNAGNIPGFDARKFLETSVNLSALELGASCTRGSFVQADIRTRASDETNSALKDRARAAINIPPRCAGLTLEKKNDSGELVGGATFKLTPNPVTGTGTLTVTDGGAGDSDGTANGRIHLDTDYFGLVTVEETVPPAGYLLPADRTQTVTPVEFGSYVLTFVDPSPWKNLTVSKTAVGSYEVDHTWNIDKSVELNGAPVTDPVNVAGTTTEDFDYSVQVSQDERTVSNIVVSGVITVNNPNAAPVTATLADVLADGTLCTIAGSDADNAAPGRQVVVAAGGSTYNYSCAPSAEPASLAGSNSATVTWDLAKYPQTQAHVDSPNAAGTKTATAVQAFTYTVTNTNKTITVVDDQQVFVPEWIITWGDGAANLVRNYTVAHGLETAGTCDDFVNTATVVETEQQASTTVTVCSGADLVVTKNVTGAFNRSYPWDIEKTAVDGDGPYETNADGEVVVDYQVTVTPGTPTDSNWAMTGVMTVENPNDWQDITATLSDSVDVGGGAQCVVTGVTGDAAVADLVPGTPEFDAVIAKNSSMDFDYSCTFTSLPSYTGINTAAATWDMATAYTPTGTASGTAAVSVGTWTETALNKTVTITDNHHLFDPAWTITWAEGMVPQVRNYSITWTVPDNAEGKCADFTNIATVTGNNGFTDTDNSTISACYPPKLNVEKTSDPVTGSYVEPGSTVAYTLSFENSGGLPAEVKYIDHLSDIFDDATFNLNSLNAETGLTAVLDGDKIVITGSVAPGTTVSVSYSVTVKTDNFGNGVAINFLLPEGENPPETCDPEVVECTEHPILGSVLWEKVDVLGNALSGSEWELTGPGETAPKSIEDCIAASAADCTDLDIDPAAGAFKIKSLEWGVYALKETKAPAGFILDSTVKTFTIGGAAPAQMIWDFDPIENEQQPGLDLPLTGGMGSQTFLFAGGIALLASLALVAWRRRKEGDVA